MAIATLSDLYNNPKVFTGVVKIRKGLTAKLILESKNIRGLHIWFNKLSNDILSRYSMTQYHIHTYFKTVYTCRIPEGDPSAQKTREICLKINDITARHTDNAAQKRQLLRFSFVSFLVLIGSVYNIIYGTPTKAELASTLGQGKPWKVHSFTGLLLLVAIWIMVGWATFFGGADPEKPVHSKRS